MSIKCVHCQAENSLPEAPTKPLQVILLQCNTCKGLLRTQVCECGTEIAVEAMKLCPHGKGKGQGITYFHCDHCEVHCAERYDEPIHSKQPIQLSKGTRTDEELFALTEEILDGKIWGSWMFKENPEMLPSVFMLFYLLPKEQAEQLKKEDVIAIFEHAAEAGPMSGSGFPSFMSFHTITAEEQKRLKVIFDRTKQAREGIKAQVLEEMG